jgi:putative acetyltransferase
MAAVTLEIAEDEPDAEDVRDLLGVHLAFSQGTTPLEYSFALDADGLGDPAVTFFSARRAGVVVGFGALKALDAAHAEIKSMHVRQSERGRGVGRALLDHLLGAARDRGFRRVSLETGTTPEFAPARALYAGAGFRPCGPFADYRASPYNTFFTLELDGRSGR